jgi:hypothetical protein
MAGPSALHQLSQSFLDNMFFALKDMTFALRTFVEATIF